MHYAELPEPLHGKEVWLQGAEMMRRAFPDLEARVDDVVAAEDRVVLRLTFTGTHAGDFHLGEFQTLPGYRPDHRVRQPRVLPHHQRTDRRRVDLLGHRALLSQLKLSPSLRGRGTFPNARAAERTTYAARSSWDHRMPRAVTTTPVRSCDTRSTGHPQASCCGRGTSTAVDPFAPGQTMARSLLRSGDTPERWRRRGWLEIGMRRQRSRRPCSRQVRALRRGSAATPKHCCDHVRAEERKQQH